MVWAEHSFEKHVFLVLIGVFGGFRWFLVYVGTRLTRGTYPRMSRVLHIFHTVTGYVLCTQTSKIVPYRTRCQKKMARGEFQWQNCEFSNHELFFLSRHDEIEKSDSINFVRFLHDGQCVSNYHSVFFIISFTRIFISNYLRHSLLIWQNKTSQCFREIHPLLVEGSEFCPR